MDLEQQFHSIYLYMRVISLVFQIQSQHISFFWRQKVSVSNSKFSRKKIMADSLDFRIPMNPTQLEEDSELKLCVINLDEIQEIASLINTIRQQLERPFVITNHDVFSTVYSILKFVFHLFAFL